LLATEIVTAPQWQLPLIIREAYRDYEQSARSVDARSEFA